MGQFMDLTGHRFGRLLVIGQSDRTPSNKITWHCKCDCGNVCNVITQHLKSGHTKSCGCYNKDQTRNYFTSHGGTHSRLYRIWSCMKTRCYNSKSKTYSYYGGRGISVCDEWLHDFARFQTWAIAHGYQDDLTIDRIDNDKGYSPSNCRWATWHEQRINQKRCRKKEPFGATNTERPKADETPTKKLSVLYYFNRFGKENQV